MLVFSIGEFMNNSKCYEFLKRILHPLGFCCRRCGKAVPEDQHPQKVSSRGTPSFKCRYCGAVFNIFSDTIFQGVTYSCITIVLMLRGFLQGKTTKHLSKELKVSYANLLDWRHKLQEFCFENRDLSLLPDDEVESDEVFINAGEKGEKHSDPEDPPRVRANKKKGWELTTMIVLLFKG